MRYIGAAGTVGTEQPGEESSESDGETEPAKSFHRSLSTNREIKCAVSSVCRIYIEYVCDTFYKVTMGQWSYQKSIKYLISREFKGYICVSIIKV